MTSFVRGQKRTISSLGDKKKNTSLRLDAKTLKALKLAAVEEDSSIQQLIERLIRDYLKQREGKQKS